MTKTGVRDHRFLAAALPLCRPLAVPGPFLPGNARDARTPARNHNGHRPHSFGGNRAAGGSKEKSR